jgi:hypothetical protein
MLTWGEAVEVHALRERGWSIAAIARHLDRNPKTIRAYVNGEREPGRRRRRAPDPLAPYVGYLAARFVDDPHIWASALYDEVSRLGYRLSYVSFARQLRTQGCAHTARRAPGCAASPRSRSTTRRVRSCSGTGSSAAGRRGVAPRTCCSAACRTRGGSVGCWPRRPTSPSGRGDRRRAAPLRRHGAGLAHRSAGHGRGARDRGCAAKLCSGGQALRRHGPAVPVAAGQPQGVGGVGGAVCVRPLVADHDRHDDRRGARVAGSVLGHGRRRSAPPVAGRRGRRSHDRGCAGRRRAAAGPTGRALPGHRRGHPPGGHRRYGGLPRQPLLRPARPDRLAAGAASPARHRHTRGVLGGGIAAGNPSSGTSQRRPAGPYAEHRTALEGVVLGAFSTARPCQRKGNHPPGPAALAEAARLLGPAGREVTVDLGRYAELVGGVVGGADVATRPSDGERAERAGGTR